MKSHCNGFDTTEGAANKKINQSQCISSQPTASVKLQHHDTGETEREAEPPDHVVMITSEDPCECF